MSEVQIERSISVFDDYAHYSTAKSATIVREKPLADLLSYWQSIRGNRSFPRKADINPVDIPWALSTIYLVDCVPPPVYWRYSIAGNEIESAFNRNTFRGVGMNEILAQPSFDVVCRRWQPVRDGKAIVYMHGLIYKTMDKSRVGARLLLPLSDDGTTVDAVVGMSVTHKLVSQLDTEPARLDITTIGLEHIGRG